MVTFRPEKLGELQTGQENVRKLNKNEGKVIEAHWFWKIALVDFHYCEWKFLGPMVLEL